MPILSIIIPTHKRAETLARCLEHIEQQTAANELEVIVVSDGHDAKTAELFANRSWHVPLKFLEIEKSQQGVARNRGVKEANGKYVLFIGDDIFLAPDACADHLSAHRRLIANRLSLTAVLGFVTWDPALEITPVMKWLETSGWQFGYPKIQKYAQRFLPEGMQANFTYTSNISLPTEITKAHLFREDVSLYGWEDIEWGMRLRDAGVHLFYEPDACALHHHTLSLEQSLQRMRTLGQSLVNIATIIPEFRKKLSGWRLFKTILLALLPTTSGAHRGAFLQGIREETKNR
ncbi:MAG: glycosyltransferase [Candidatus Peribacteraceae bacterium]|nr:glycosyltransferase [Candidatus Peribacteraceae bacterium]